MIQVYDVITEVDAFEFSTRMVKEGKMNGLKNLLIDLDGLGRTDKGAQLLRDCRRFQFDPVMTGGKKTDGK